VKNLTTNQVLPIIATSSQSKIKRISVLPWNLAIRAMKKRSVTSKDPQDLKVLKASLVLSVPEVLKDLRESEAAKALREM
jgi:hypothetical protein